MEDTMSVLTVRSGDCLATAVVALAIMGLTTVVLVAQESAGVASRDSVQTKRVPIGFAPRPEDTRRATSGDMGAPPSSTGEDLGAMTVTRRSTTRSSAGSVDDAEFDQGDLRFKLSAIASVKADETVHPVDTCGVIHSAVRRARRPSSAMVPTATI
jgi:hypothetical protein